MSADQDQARLQEIEAHLRSLDEQVSVLSAVGDAAAKQRVADTFGDPRTVIIYRGVQRSMTQEHIAAELKARDLPGAQQPRVSETLTKLEELGFVKRRPDASFHPHNGWCHFGLERTLKKTLRTKKIADLD